MSVNSCNWCKDTTKELFRYNNLGNEYIICKKCATYIKIKVCRCCGESLGNNSIEGICLICIQTNSQEENKAREEKNAGVDYETLKEYTSDRQMTEEDFNAWMVSNPFGAPTQSDIRKKWLLKKVKGDPNWNEDKVNIYMPTLEKLMNKYFDKVNNKHCKFVVFDSTTSFKPGSIVAIEGNIVLIDESI